MKIKEITYGLQYTYPIKDFQNIKPSLTYKAEITEDDSVNECLNELKGMVNKEMKNILNSFSSKMKENLEKENKENKNDENISNNKSS